MRAQRPLHPPRRLALLSLLPLAGALVAVRLQLPGPLRWIRWFNRRFCNRLTVGIAGRRGSPFSLVRHVGRRTGRQYQTPVRAAPTARGFAIGLTFGRATDWCQNVLAAGRFTLVHGGAEYLVGAPRPVARAEVLAAFPLPVRLLAPLLGIREFLQVDIQQ